MFKVIFFLFLLCTGILARDTLINLEPYSSGELVVPGVLRGGGPGSVEWYKDTITFSNGVKVTFGNIATRCMTYYGMGNIIFIDTVSVIGYEYHTGIHRSKWTTPILAGMYIATANVLASWNAAKQYPDSLAICDSSAAVEDGQDSTFFLRTKILYSAGYSMTDPVKTNLNSERHGIVYIKAGGVHLKMHVSKITTRTTLMEDTLPDTVTCLWAVDSLGNGVFKHDPVFIKNNKKNVPIYYSKSLTKGAQVFDVFGRRVKILNLKSGIYLTRINGNVRKFVLTK